MPVDHPSPATLKEAAATADDDPIVSIGADVDVRAIVAQVKAEVARKAEQNLYPPDLMAELIASSDKLLGAVEAVRNTQHVEFRPRVRSQRRLIGAAVTLAKWSIRRGLRFETNHMAEEVNLFAGNAANALALAAERIQDLEEQQSSASERIERLERRLRYVATASRSASAAEEGAGGPTPSHVAPVPGHPVSEDRFRGASQEVALRLEGYVKLFRGQESPILDIGCGPGAFLARLKQAGIAAYGIDSSPEMVEQAEREGLTAKQADVFAHLESLAPDSLGGVFSAQAIQHYGRSNLMRFFELAARALAPGGVFVTETVNPGSLSSYIGPLYADVGKVRPVHPLTLQFLAQTAGLGQVEIRFLAPVPAEDRLALIPPEADGHGPLIEGVNANFRRIDEAMFGPVDFVLLARK